MSFNGKTIFDRVCGAGSYLPNKAPFFPLGKIHYKSQLSDSSIICDAIEGNLHVPI